MAEPGPIGSEDLDHRSSAPTGAGLARLAEALGGGEVHQVQRLAGGLDGATHAFRIEDRRYVLKRPNPGAEPAAAAREFRNLGVARSCEAPTPEPLLLDEAGDWFGAPALVMTALPGRVDLHPEEEERWVRELARGLVAVHDVAPAGVAPPPGPPVWESEDWRPPPAAEGAEPWRSRAEAVARVQDGVRRTAEQRPRVLSHQDYHPGNVLFDGGTLSGITDWLYAAAEPREAGVAFARKDLAIHPGGDAPDRFLAAYEAETGSRLDVAAWDVLQGAHALRWGHRWVTSFAEVGVTLTAGQIADAAARFVDAALARCN